MPRKFANRSTAVAVFLLTFLFDVRQFVESRNISSDPIAAPITPGTEGNEKNHGGEYLRFDDSCTAAAAASQQQVQETNPFTFPITPSPTDPDGIPYRWMVMAKYNRQVALQAFRSTLAWREQHAVDTILWRPHVKFDQVKAIFPHFFTGRDIFGNVIFVQRPGLVQLDLKHKLNISNEEMYHHIIYVFEYCWNILEPGQNSTMTNVIDLSGLSFGMMHNNELISFVKDIVSISSHHYPTRSFKTFVVNAPRWFGALFNLLKPLLRESTREKIEIYTGGKKQDEALMKILGESFPEELVSTKIKESTTNAKSGVNSIQERHLRDFCVEGLQRAGEKMLLATP
jgi:hypothetical protein